jgi:hypothetical protein
MRYVPGLVAMLALLSIWGFARTPYDAALASSTLNRPADPVVLTGADVPSLQGLAPGDIVAFRYNGGWQQIPVQVDQRFVQNFSTVYNGLLGFANVNVSELVYADPGTFTGPDPNPTLDTDDEIVFMAKDAGGTPASFSEPGGVVADTGVQVAVTDPLNPSQMGWVYLFRRSGTLDPSAGQSYVAYNFNLLSGSYKTTYRVMGGPNAENSTVTTPYYSRHFGDRWQDDGLNITAGSAAGVNILDRHKALFAPGVCVRSEDTFDKGGPDGFPGEGAFITNKVGPVRAIRSYIGANSGPNTERDHIFYAQREDIRTALRVHPISSIMDFNDYSPAASGMRYYNDFNTGGVLIDGVPDSPAGGAIHWQMVTGAQGSLVMSGSVATNIPGFAYTSYYEDNKTSPTAQCTGDGYAYGASGTYVNPPGGLPCTDPGMNFGCTAPVYDLGETTTAYYGAPGFTVPDAQAMNAAAQQPLTFTTSAWQNPVNACPYDLDHNGKVGLSDLLIFAAAYNATPSSGNWNPAADFDADNKIGLGDLLLFAAHYNRIASGCPP